MVTNNVTVYQFEVGLDEVFADEVRFHVNVDCVIVVVVKDCLFFMSFILCENCEFVKWTLVSRFLYHRTPLLPCLAISVLWYFYPQYNFLFQHGLSTVACVDSERTIRVLLSPADVGLIVWRPLAVIVGQRFPTCGSGPKLGSHDNLPEVA